MDRMRLFSVRTFRWRSDWTWLTLDIVPRMQFYAIEIARNKNGLNDWIYEKSNATAAEKETADPK